MTLISRKTIKKANSMVVPQKLKDKIYMLYSMVMIAEGLCLDTKQMEAYESLCKMRKETKGSEEHGILSERIEVYYNELGYAKITLLYPLLYVIAKEAKKVKANFLSLSPVSTFINENEARHIEEVALKNFLNMGIVKEIDAKNHFILNYCHD